MAMNIKDAETERLAGELARRIGATKTAAVREALRERLDHLPAGPSEADSGDEFVEFLRQEIWSHVATSNRGKSTTKQEREEILGYGPGGV